MEVLKTLVWIALIISAISMIILILMQHGKGADAGATFGSGSAQGVFGASGSANFLSRATGICAVIFISACLALAWMAARPSSGLKLDLKDGQKSTVTQPATVPETPTLNTSETVIPE